MQTGLEGSGGGDLEVRAGINTSVLGFVLNSVSVDTGMGSNVDSILCAKQWPE